MNMQQPDPAGLFEQFKGKRQQPPANRSVIAQLDQPTVPPANLPPVQPAPVARAAEPPAPLPEQEAPVNPFVALHQSGAMATAIAEATQTQENPFLTLYQSGAMTGGILEAEDQDYEKELKKYQKRRKEYIPYPGMGAAADPQQPQAPARDMNTIQQHWGRGVHYLRGNELGNIFHRIETAQTTPEEDGFIASQLEPQLSPEIQQQLNISRMTRSKFLDLQQAAQTEEQTAREFQEASHFMTPGQIAHDPRFTQHTEQQNVFGRALAKGLTANYAFAPDEERLNSDNPEEVADERAKRAFYQNQEQEYPVTALGGNILGAMAPIGANIGLIRAGRTALAARSLAAGPPTARTAAVIASRATPQTTAGILAEGAAAGLPYDIVMRPEGSESMTAEEKTKARVQQVGLGLGLGIAGDLLLTKGLPMLAKGGAKLGDVLNISKDSRRQKELDTLTRENTEYDNFNDLLNASTELVTDANGNQVLRLKTEPLDVLPELEAPVREAEHVKELLPQETGGRPVDQGGFQETIQTGPGERSRGDQAAPESHTIEPTGAPDVETPATGRREPALIEHKLIEQADEIATAPAEPPVQERVTGLQTVEAPLDELTLSADVPQFKSGADESTGVVEPLGGTFDRTGVAPIQVWVRSDGRKEIISGRHRVDLARRSGEKTIPAQYHYESGGFGPQQAATMDALLNIREGQGKVKDYVDFIKASGITEAEADAQGILARATGKRAYTIATFGSDTLITAHRAGQLSDEAATRLAGAAPGNEKLQAVGIKALQDGKSITVAENMVKAVRSMTGDTGPTSSADMFGFDDSAMQEAERMARAAAAKQAEIQRTLSAVKGASKNPELAAKEGIDIRDKDALKQRIEELEQQKRDWNNWHTNPELTAQLRGEQTQPPFSRHRENDPAQEPEPEPKPTEESFDLTTHTEQDITTRETATREAEAAQQKEQQALADKAKADSEVADFELGIQGSGRDVSARQTDLLGLTRETPAPPPPQAKEQHNTRSSTYETTVVEAEPATVQAKAPAAEAVPKIKPEVKAEPAGETSYTRVTNTPDDTDKGMKGGPYTFDYHNQTTRGLREGTLSLEDYQAAGRALLDNKQEVMARLNKLTKDKLMALGGKFYPYPRDVKKPEALQDAYNRLLNLYKSEKPTESGWEITKLPKQSDLEQSIRKAIDDTTQADLDDLTKRYSEHKTQREKEAAETKARIENPQTLEDFEFAIRENGKESLTTAQRAEYERLNAESQWQAREQREQAQQTKETKGLETEQELEVEPITEGTHTKTGATIYNVKLTTRLDKEQFAQAAKTAKSLGGNYYRGNFWLPDREKVEQFVSWLNGQTIDRTPQTMAKETARADKNVSKLREMADKLEQQGEADYNRERTTNTARQLNQATSARAEAQKKINFARTLRNIANGIEDGSIRFLSKLTSQTQLDELNQIKRNAIPAEMIDDSYNGYSMSRTLKEGITLEDYIDRITLPQVSIHTDYVRKLIEAMKGKRGFADARKNLETELSVAIRSDNHLINLQPHSMAAAKVDELVRKHKVDAGWLFNDTMARVKRIQKMGLTTDDQLRSAIRELEAVRSGGVMSANAEHKLDALRLKIKQNARNFNDFFPTPDDVVHRVMELADVQPGMKTLEPNTGMGHMAKQLQAAAGAENVDLVEISPQLIEYLKASGFGDVTQSDFLKFGVKDSYDRIVMNPPFSKNQDIDHVQHAYDLLKPGGKMTAIVSNMAGLRTDKKNRAFSQWLDDVGAHVEDLEDGAFKSSFNPTGVKTKVIVIDKPVVEVKAEAEARVEPQTGVTVYEPVKLNDFQQREKQHGGNGLAGELNDNVVNSLMAMRNSPNVPSLTKVDKGSYVAYQGRDKIPWHDIGNGASIRGYSKGGDVIQEIRLPSDLVMTRVLKQNGTLYGEFSGNYDQIVKGEGFAEVEEFIKNYYSSKSSTPAPAIAETKASPEIPAVEQPQKAVVTPEEYHYEEARDAFMHSSRSAPASYRERFVKNVQETYDENLKLAKTPEQQQALDTAIEQFKKDYLAAEKQYFRVRSNTVSAHIAGRSKFDAKRAERNYKADDNALATMAREINAAKAQVELAVMNARSEAQKQVDQTAAAAKAHEQRILNHILPVGRALGDIADDLRNHRPALAADYRKTAMPKAFREVEKALEIDRSLTIEMLKTLDKGLDEFGGLAKVAGPRSKLAQLYKQLQAEKPETKPAETVPSGATLYSTPIIPAAKQAAELLHLNPRASTAGAVYGGIEGGDRSEEERYSKNWWLDLARGAALGAVAGAAGVSALKTIPIKGKTILGESSWGRKAYDITGQAIRKLPGMNPGDPDLIPLKKRQQLMKAIIEKQAEKAGEYLLKNFTPSQRSIMADLIEQRGIVADGNILHQQAKELDDFISYTSTKLQELGMLADDIEPGGYLHRYYSKHLGLTGLARSFTPKGAAISGTWSRRRGTSEVYDSRYFSQSMRDTMDKIQQLRDEYNALKKQTGDIVDSDTQARLDELKAQYRDLEKIEFREYLAPENGQIKSFFLAQDEVPVIPGLKSTSTGLAHTQPGTQGTLGAMPPPVGKTGQLVLTDRRWTIDGKKSDTEGVLHRDWTKAERESWGEITDAAYRMVRGQTEVAHDLSLATLFKTIDDTYNGTKVSDTEIEGWVQVPKTTVGQGSRLKKYGALEGKYVTPELWQSIRNHGRNPLTNIFASSKVLEPYVPAVKAYLGTLQKWKAYKTVYNPVSHMNNAASNLMMYQLSDYDNKHIWQAFKELRKGEHSAAVAEAQRAGLFGTDWTSEISGTTGAKKIDDLLEDLRTQPEIPDFEPALDRVMRIKQWFIESASAVKNAKGPWRTGAELAKAIGNPFINTAKKPIDKAVDVAQAAYRAEDELFRLAVYLAEREKGIRPFDAVQNAQKYFFDYSDMPDGMKLVRDLPIGSPFISYTYFAIPAIVRTAIEKPERILGFVAALEGLNYAALSLNGELQEQGYWDHMADEEALYPTWMKGRSLFGALNNVSLPFVESYKLSLANMLPAGNPFVGQSERPGYWPSIFSAFGQGPEGSNPFVKLIFDLSKNQDWKGSPIYAEGAPASEQIRKAINYVYQNLAPSNPLFPGSYSQQKILEGFSNQVRQAKEEGEEPNRLIESIVDIANATSQALGGEQFTGIDRRENEILTRDALLGSIGIKLRPIRLEQFAESKAMDIKGDIGDVRKYLRSRERLYDEGRLTGEQIEARRLHAEQRFSELEQQDNKLMEAMLR